jgi:hypothetical protein
MISKSKLRGVKVFKTFHDYVKDIAQIMERQHDLVHNSYRQQLIDAAKKQVKRF